jgi:hypothetical protein
MAAHVGGDVNTQFKTFDISAPALEDFLSQEINTYTHRQVVGVEFIKNTV